MVKEVVQPDESAVLALLKRIYEVHPECNAYERSIRYYLGKSGIKYTALVEYFGDGSPGIALWECVQKRDDYVYKYVWRCTKDWND